MIWLRRLSKNGSFCTTSAFMPALTNAAKLASTSASKSDDTPLPINRCSELSGFVRPLAALENLAGSELGWLKKPVRGFQILPGEPPMGLRFFCAFAVCLAFAPEALAGEQPGVFRRASCGVVRYYVAKYCEAAAESWARSKGC